MMTNSRRGKPYVDGELAIILGIVPTERNIQNLSKLLGRSAAAIEIVHGQASGFGSFGESATSQRRKIMAAKRELRLAIGRRL